MYDIFFCTIALYLRKAATFEGYMCVYEDLMCYELLQATRTELYQTVLG